MRLVQAIQPGKNIRLAFVGSGGKTTAMFQLAKQLEEPVLVTASTHLSTSELSLADRVITIESAEDLNSMPGKLQAGVTLLIGPPAEEEGRLQGLSLPLMDHVHQYADRHGVPLLIEADGSRQRPLKAPAAHEPPIPPFVDMVVVVAGIKGVGQPLNDQWVHRPAQFALLSGMVVGEVISKRALVNVLTHEQGGLKNIPTQARRLALLTHAESPECAGAANAICCQLIGSYEALVIANLLDSPEDQVISAHRHIAGVVLAAGGSDRFGQPKQLMDWGGQPFVRVVAQTAIDALLQPVIVVTGRDHSQVEQALAGLDVIVVQNPDWLQGQSQSVKAGLAVVPENVGGAMFLMVDQPQIPVDLVQSLREMHAKTLAPVVATMVEGRRGNPVLFDRQTFGELSQVSGDAGGRQIFSKYHVTYLPWVDARIGLDVDTPEDYDHLLESGII